MLIKPIRLIELFAGIGSQAMALKELGINFEHYKVIENNKYAINTYNAIHNTNFPLIDIKDVSGEDLVIRDINKYEYILTYSFPCQDLSIAGSKKGMTKGSNTRSGLLWEIERILNEINNLPQILLMENVSAIHYKSNMNDFKRWVDFLSNKGYKNFYQDLNAKDYGIPQNRNRCFMVSILTNDDIRYKFPEKMQLDKNMRSCLESEVDEKYYIYNDKVNKIINELFITDIHKVMLELDNISYPVIDEIIQLGNIYYGYDKWSNSQRGRLYSKNGVCPTLRSSVGGGYEPKILDISMKDNCKIMIRLRKLTPLEYWRLMGFSDEDFYKAQKINSNTQLYRQAGNSIALNCLVKIFKNLIYNTDL